MRLRPTKLAGALVFACLILFAVGTNVQAGWLIVLTALVLGALAAGLVLPALAVRGIEVARLAPESAFAGDRVEVSLVVRSRAPSARGLVLVRDRFLGTGAAVVPRLAAGESRTYIGERDAVRRGVHVSGPCEIATGAPFGVARATRHVKVSSQTVVYPRVYDVADPGRLAGVLTEGGRPRPAAAGDSTSVREYRPGDPLRHVHWRSSARTGRLVVREFEEHASGDVAVLVVPGADDETVDAVTSAACSYAIAAVDAGRRVVILWPEGDGVRRLEARSRRDALEWGARLAPAAEGTLHAAVPRAHALVAVAGSRAPALTRELCERGAVLAVLVGADAIAHTASLSAAGTLVVSVPDGSDLESVLR